MEAMEHQRCYIYTPPDGEGPSPKRQRISRAGPKAHLSTRLESFQVLWSLQEERIQKTIEEVDKAIQEDIVTFVSAAPKSEIHAIPTGLVVAGPSIASHGSFFERLRRRFRDETDSAYVVLTSGESPNLKTLLKNLISKATSLVSGEDDDDDNDLGHTMSTSRGRPKLLNFDVGHLLEWQTKNQAKSIIVTIQDSEAFDANVLVELIDLFYSWLDRLPFVLLFGIATSAERFEDRLSAKSLRYLDGKKFDVTQSDEIVQKIFSVTVAGRSIPVRIGPNLSRRILDRQKDHVQNAQDFSDSLKYAYLSHFYATYPTLFITTSIPFEGMPTDAFEAVRNLPSFRKLVESMLDEGRTHDVRRLLDSNQCLFENIYKHIDAGHEALNALSGATTVLSQLRDSFQMSPQVPHSSIWIRAASGDIVGSPLLRETLLSIKKIPSDKLLQAFMSFYTLGKSVSTFDIIPYHRELEQLISKNTDSAPLRSQHDVRNESTRTTVVAQKVLLSKHKAALSEQDKAYSELVGRFHDDLEEYFSKAFIDPHNLFLIEILMYDLKSPHTEVFQPRPRFAIERALASPHDYLGCECCGADAERNEEGALSSTQPATAILYQMYLESGSLINVSDLWSAFHAITGEEGEDSESKSIALFQRALAELKYLGLVKPSRKKTDHIAKMMWKGL